MLQQRIYEHAKDTVERLLQRAGNGSGATLLIPDLQRPYRWQPTEIAALVDSLLRGWPFGTLLVWEIGLLKEPEARELIPARTFWSHVDRTGHGGGAVYGKATVPADFSMILDGQQRLQSLLLACQGDDSGFKLYDADWFDVLFPEKERSRAKSHWSWGQLCLDVERFSKQFDRANGDAARIYYQDVLIWVVCNAQKGFSPNRGPSYSAPLPHFDSTRHLRFSKLWALGRADLPLKQVREAHGELLRVHGIDQPRRGELAEQLTELALRIAHVKQTEVAYLKVLPVDANADEASRDRYDEAVVNIFTRLNSGGTPLTQQEILFAWIKRKWLRGETDERDADECFEALRAELEEQGISLGMDELVRGVSVLWSACENRGELLGEAQFRRGLRMNEMAPWLAKRWARVTSNCKALAQALLELEIQQGRHFDSANSLFVLWSWRFLIDEWTSRQSVGFLEGERTAGLLADGIGRWSDRWMLIPQWAGHWQRAENFPKYVRDLGQLWGDLSAEKSVDAALGKWQDRMRAWLEEAKTDALRFVQVIHAERRNTVRRYYALLWAWHMLDARRGRMAKLNLEVKSKKVAAIEVDHIVGYAYWEKELLAELGPNASLDALDDGPNALGNCILLHKNFNVSKQEHPIADLLADVFEFRNNPTLLHQWRESLAVSDPLYDPSDSDVSAIRAAVAERTKIIRTDLAKFIRHEVETVAAEVVDEATNLPWDGEWETVCTDKRLGQSWPDKMRLKQHADGTLTGESDTGGKLTAKIHRDSCEGRWEDGESKGGFRWDFSGSQDEFLGEWGNGRNRRGRGTWTGKRLK